MATRGVQGRRTKPSGAKKRAHFAPAARPFEPGRSEPPLPTTDDLEAYVSPPLRGKAHPPGDMDQATPSRDDEVQRYHQPADETTAFGFDPDAADAAADLAGDLGATFLTGATRGEDMSDVVASEDRDEDELLLVEEEGEGELVAVGPADESEREQEEPPPMPAPAPTPAPARKRAHRPKTARRRSR